MAEDVSILSEIDEALRADKVQEFWARNSSAVLTFCVMAVLATAASVFWKDHLHKTHEEQTRLLTRADTLLKSGKTDDAIKLYAEAEQQGGGLAALAALDHAAALLTLKENDKALDVYSSLAAGKIKDSPDALRDFAALQADILVGNKALAAGTSAGPSPVTESGVFRRALAETDALNALKSGDEKTAAAKLNGVMNDDSAPFSERIRAAELLNSVKEEKPGEEKK